jgi:hypothetical protein
MNSYDYGKHQTNDRYWESKRTCSKDKDEDKEIMPSDTELTKQRVESFQAETQREKRDAFQTLIKSLIFIVVSTTTLLIHWHIAKKARTVKA